MKGINLKVGQKVRFRNGIIGKVVAFKEDFGRLFGTPYQASYKDKEMNILYCYNDKGELKTDGSKSELDIVEILEEPKNEEMKENKGKFELSITVNDINNSCKNDKYYFTESLDLSKDIRNLRFDNTILYQLLTNSEALSNKSDTFKFSKIIKLNEKELGKITIRVTQLTD